MYKMWIDENNTSTIQDGEVDAPVSVCTVTKVDSEGATRWSYSLAANKSAQNIDSLAEVKEVLFEYLDQIKAQVEALSE